jgi:hypothetical protein
VTHYRNHFFLINIPHSQVYCRLAEILNLDDCTAFIHAPSISLFPSLRKPHCLHPFVNTLSQFVSTLYHIYLVFKSRSLYTVLSEYYSLFLPLLLIPLYFKRGHVILNVNHNLDHNSYIVRFYYTRLHRLLILLGYRFLFLDIHINLIATRCRLSIGNLRHCLFLPFPYTLLFDTPIQKFANVQRAKSNLSNAGFFINSQPVFSILFGRPEQINYSVIARILTKFLSSKLNERFTLLNLFTRNFSLNSLPEELSSLVLSDSFTCLNVTNDFIYYSALAASSFILLPYHPKNYSIRHSGILVESLSRGVQVIAPYTDTFSSQANGLAYLYRDELNAEESLCNLEYPSLTNNSYISWYSDLRESVNLRQQLFPKLSTVFQDVGSIH